MGSETLDFILWTVVLVLLRSNTAMTKDHLGYYAAYACDGKMLKIECKEGYVINLIRANYGRYSITVCNDNGSTDWSVNCMSHRSSNILQARCSSKRNCSVPASTSLFDDPCPGTVKYLEAHYACVSASASSSTSRPTHPWLMTSPPSVWITAKSFTVHPEIVIPSTMSASSITSSTSTTKIWIQPEKDHSEWKPPPLNENSPVVESSSENEFILPPESTNTETQISSSEMPILPENSNLPLCKPVFARNLSWNWTVAGNISVQPCPGGASGFARYKCHKVNDHLAIRYPEAPDLSECRSIWLNTLERAVNEGGESLINIATDLCQVTENKPLYGGDILTAAKIIRDLAQKMSKDMQVLDQRQREVMAYDLLQSVAVVGSNMLNASKQPSWNDLSPKEQMRVATSLLVGLEENSFLLAETFVRERKVTHCTKNMLLSVQVLETRNVGNELFPTYSILENCSLRVNNWLQLQRSSLLENNVSGLVRLVYIAFDTLEYVLKVQPNSNEEKMINSKVLSASLGKGRHIQLSEPVTLCLQHLQTENVSNPTCVFWDYTQSIWSEEGCKLIATNKTHTICQCDHLTNFAILVDVKSTFLARQFSLISVLLIIVVLVLFIITFVLIFKYYWKQNTRKDYGSAFIQENEWFSKCFGCCQSATETEKTLNCKDPRPALYGNPTMQSITSMDTDGTTICTTRITHAANTIPRSYAINNTGGIENHYPASHIRLNHNYPTYNRNGSIRKIKEARRLEHLENTLQYHRNKKLAGTLRSNSPRSSHTYSEIAAGSSRNDPVYEEIEREREHCSQISDISDEDAKRQSDMSRQSSKSYGDHRPLIPYNQVPDCSFRAAMDAAYRQQLKEHGSARTVSVLDGQTVICHLQPPDPRLYQKTVSHYSSHY